MTAVCCDGVSVRLGDVPILDRVSLGVDAGSWITIVGPNGAGKSTLLNALGGVLRYAGSIRVMGRELSGFGVRERSRVIARVPQQPVLPPGMLLTDYVLLGRTPHLRLLGVEGGDDLAQIESVLRRLDLIELAGHRLETLSGGELQRAHIARALAQATPVLLLDEPTTALDLGHQQEALELVDQLRRERRLAVVSTMHDLTLAGQYSDRLVLLKSGAVVGEGSAEDVLTSEALSTLYGASVRVVHEGGDVVVLPLRGAAERSDRR